MRQSRYLNVILTINAVLLAGLLWTQVAGGPVLPEFTPQAAAQAPGMTNAAAQRQQMIESLREMRRSSERTHKMLEEGRLRVQVTNLDEISRN